MLDEGGSGSVYEHPGRSASGYFKLSHRYWLDGWCDLLDLPAKATLLILLSRRPGADLPHERVMAWYGISADTFGRGVKKLSAADLIDVKVVTRKAPLSPLGYTWEQRYTPLPPFARINPPSRVERAAK